MILSVIAGCCAVITPTASAQTTSEVEMRDRLIAKQESLLNSYRCEFGFDTHLVPDGCPHMTSWVIEVKPVLNPTLEDIAIRDNLIAEQESLLNSYRCEFNVDIWAVAGRCPGECSEVEETTVYDWESCTWTDVPNPNLELSEINILIDEIWGEIEVEAKPATRPKVIVCSNDSDISRCPYHHRCPKLSDSGCYVPPPDHVIVLDSQHLWLVLHETTHALLGGLCADESCYHDQNFKCLADQIYQTYGNTVSAGMCGWPESRIENKPDEPLNFYIIKESK